MWLNLYLCGWVLITIGTFVAADILGGLRTAQPLPRVGMVVVLAGALWPVVVLGLLEMAAIAVVARTMRATAVRCSDRSSTQ